MQTVPFLGIERANDHDRWRISDISALTTSGGFLFGGAGLAAAVAALEGTTGRSLRWATAQHLAFATRGDVVDVTVTVDVEGRRTTQARAQATVGRRAVLAVTGALGDAVPEIPGGEWAVRPSVPPPEACPRREARPGHADTITQRIETRIAAGRQHAELDGTAGDGRSALWARVPELDCGAALLALLGDHVPFGVGQALGVDVEARSLDNTVRVARIVPTEWVLLDVRVHAIADGYGHGTVHLWADDGTLLGTASQTCAIRRDRG